LIPETTLITGVPARQTVEAAANTITNGKAIKAKRSFDFMRDAKDWFEAFIGFSLVLSGSGFRVSKHWIRDSDDDRLG
jgi:hypothetical protein